jgi:hypothetical protein
MPGSGGVGRPAARRAGTRRAGGTRRRVTRRTVPRGQEAGQHAEALAAAEARRSHGCDRWVAAGILVVVAAGTVSAWLPGMFPPAASSGAGGQGAHAPATAVNATVRCVGSYTVKGQRGGTLTWLPSAGKVINQRQATGNRSPVILLYGSIPAWRTLDEGT